MQYEDHDLAASEYPLWQETLTEPLPQQGAGGCTPVAVIASAGTVNTGAIDPLRDMLEVCREEQVWLHVDGAYGGFGLLDPAVAHLFEGFTEADSIVVDPHKWLAVPVGCGATFVRDRDVLGRAFTLEPAEYLEGAVREVETIHSQFDNFGYITRLHAEHHDIPSSTEIHGAFAIRPCYINPRTGWEEVDGLVQASERLGAQVWRDDSCEKAE